MIIYPLSNLLATNWSKNPLNTDERLICNIYISIIDINEWAILGYSLTAEECLFLKHLPNKKKAKHGMFIASIFL